MKFQIIIRTCTFIYWANKMCYTCKFFVFYAKPNPTNSGLNEKKNKKKTSKEFQNQAVIRNRLQT